MNTCGAINTRYRGVPAFQEHDCYCESGNHNDYSHHCEFNHKWEGFSGEPFYRIVLDEALNELRLDGVWKHGSGGIEP